MDMINEDYVSFETAKLLKEKGFDEDCLKVYINGELENVVTKEGIKECTHCYNSWLYPGDAAAPTLQMAMKWLRKVHNLHCAVDYDFVLGWYCQITSLKETVEYDYEEMKHYHPDKNNGFSSPEEAYEAAIRYCLEHKIWN